MGIQWLKPGDGLVEINFPTMRNEYNLRETLFNKIVDFYNRDLIAHQSNLEINFDFRSQDDYDNYSYNFDKTCELYTTSNNNITRFDGPAITISDKNEYNHYNIDSKLYYFIINNEEIPQNIPVIHHGYCNSILNKQIITKVILEYDREYGLFLNDYMNEYKHYLLQNRNMFEKDHIARIFEKAGRYLLDGHKYF